MDMSKGQDLNIKMKDVRIMTPHLPLLLHMLTSSRIAIFRTCLPGVLPPTMTLSHPGGPGRNVASPCFWNSNDDWFCNVFYPSVPFNWVSTNVMQNGNRVQHGFDLSWMFHRWNSRFHSGQDIVSTMLCPSRELNHKLILYHYVQ